MLSNKSSSSPARVTLPPRSVLSSVIHMVFLKCVSSLATKFSVFSRATVCLLFCALMLFAHMLLFSFLCFLSNAFCLGIGLGPSIPEDLWHLIKKAVAVRKHLEVNRKDKDSKFRLILIESRIHRLARYYKTKQQIPPTFKYDSVTASTLIAWMRVLYDFVCCTVFCPQIG